MAERKKRKRRRFLQRMKKRLLIVLGIFFAIFSVLVFRLISINVKEGAEYEQRVLAQQGYTSTAIPYRRGDIVDTNGTVLATTKKVYNIILEPKNILMYPKQKAATIDALKQYFGLTDADIDRLLADENSYYKVALKKQEYDVVKPFIDYCATSEGSLVTGVVLEEEYVRVYPNNELACHLIGFTVSGNVGMYGVEQGYNDYLNGYNGRRYTYLSNDYNLEETIEPAINGYNIVTSIDANIQAIVQSKVEAYMEEEGAANVSVLVMDPSNSNILALYNSHTFDLNNAYSLDSTRYQFPNMTDEEFEEFKKNATDEETIDALNQVWRNFAVSDVYEPGSTYKVFTISGALEEGVVSIDDSFYCDGGEEVADHYIKCYSHERGGHGMLTLSGALGMSCNDALMQIAAKEGANDFDKYQVLFGFGQRTNLDIPGELTNAALSTVVYHADTLRATELATSSFGQGVTATMMQLGTAFCSVINGGYYYEPSVVQRIEDEHGNIIDNLDSVMVRRTISEDVSAIMRQQLFEAVETGTAKKGAVEGYMIGGKTGTAEKLPRNEHKYLISYIGFAPLDNPQVLIYVVVDEPNVADQSTSAGAANIFRAIAEEVFPYLNIYKTNDNYDLDISDAEDQPVDSIYEGDVPEDDVAGGNENPYVSGNNTDTDAGTDTGTDTGTDAGTDADTDADTDAGADADTGTDAGQ